ncbi:hypothetical protein [Hymenobacter sp. AT01-02]|uniref:hypothetical protein n=1 Tax=Hymenobacter sp. AT01-02 TaxID=1571877 RepID=UPI00191C4F87|nr:hypothetical protein [Hymenobacter sp. AT01-02]
MKTPSRFDGKKYLNSIPTSMSGNYGRMLRNWLLGKEERNPRRPLGPFGPMRQYWPSQYLALPCALRGLGTLLP